MYLIKSVHNTQLENYSLDALCSFLFIAALCTSVRKFIIPGEEGATYNTYHRQVSYLNWMPSWKMMMVSYTSDRQHMSAQNKIHPNKETRTNSTRCVGEISQDYS